MNYDWRYADRLSDRIVDLVNEELARMRDAGTVAPLQIFAGQLLALLAVMRTTNGLPRPASFQALERVARWCLQSMYQYAEDKACRPASRGEDR
jgi:hypothetical protein